MNHQSNYLLRGISGFSKIHRNMDYGELFIREIEGKEGVVTDSGTTAIRTGKFTGRSPKDKFIVREEPSASSIWWGNINQELSPQAFDALYDLVAASLNNSEVYVTDAFCGAEAATRICLRVYSKKAWQSHFCKNMFIRPTSAELESFKPDFIILNADETTDPNWKEHGLNSPVFIAFNIEKKIQLIGGTSYGGEMKKGMFSMMHYFLPNKNILSMHCSANMGKDGDTALFFGLSGTGKTTLSADPNRLLIGDDEHGWGDTGIFNFEGGCYAKTLDLNPTKEPDIFNAIRKDALLENVAVDAISGKVDFSDSSLTENGRVSYPLEHIESRVKPVSVGNHPYHIVFLTCDAFGVLPPVSRLNRDQAMYHFISGYTAKVAGTEVGIKEPTATFSPCFGGPFLTLPPHRYAELLGKKLDKHGSQVWLLNTGWSGGSYGNGKRMDITLTRKLLTSILNGSLQNAQFETFPVFQFEIPTEAPGIPKNLLNPENTWDGKAEYQTTLVKLASLFISNYEKYKTDEADFTTAGPQLSNSIAPSEAGA